MPRVSNPVPSPIIVVKKPSVQQEALLFLKHYQRRLKIIGRVLFRVIWTENPLEENTTHAEGTKGEKATGLKWREKNTLYMENPQRGKKKKYTGKNMECSHQMWNRPSQCHLLYMLNSLWDTKAPIGELLFFFRFLFCIKQVLPRACSQGRQKRVILNKIKQTGIA